MRPLPPFHALPLTVAAVVLAFAAIAPREAAATTTPLTYALPDVFAGALGQVGDPTAFGTGWSGFFDERRWSGVGEPIEEGNTIFTDSGAAGTVRRLVFLTSASVTVASFNLFGIRDGTSDNRAFSHFKLEAGTSQTNFTTVLYDADVTYTGNAIQLIAQTSQVVTASYFRASFTQSAANFGPRIAELAAFAPVPEPGTLGLLGLAALLTSRAARPRRSSRPAGPG